MLDKSRHIADQRIQMTAQQVGVFVRILCSIILSLQIRQNSYFEPICGATVFHLHFQNSAVQSDLLVSLGTLTADRL